MTMPRPSGFPLLLAMLLAPVAAPAAPFSRPATSVAEIHGTARPMSVAAPDDGMRAVARYMNGKLTVFTGIRGFDFAGGANAELLWSPDSDALAVTSNDDGGAEARASDGKAVDRFRAAILVRKTARKWRRIDLSRPIARLFPAARGCGTAGTPDVAALGWTSGQRLIVAATRPPARQCGARRTFAAYVVDVPSGEVLMEMDEATAKRRYRHLMGKALTERGWKPQRDEAE